MLLRVLRESLSECASNLRLQAGRDVSCWLEGASGASPVGAYVEAQVALTKALDRASHEKGAFDHCALTCNSHASYWSAVVTVAGIACQDADALTSSNVCERVCQQLAMALAYAKLADGPELSADVINVAFFDLMAEHYSALMGYATKQLESLGAC